MKLTQLARLFGVAMLVWVSLTPVPAVAQCCLGCFAEPPTLTEQLDGADLVLLVKWIGGFRSIVPELASTELEVVEVLRQPSIPKDVLLDERSLEPVNDADKLQKGLKLHVNKFQSAKLGDLFLLLGTLSEDREITWDADILTQAVFEYVKQLPGHDQPAEARLAYLLKNLESADSIIAGDAFQELNQIPFPDLVPLANQLPRDKLRLWLTTAHNNSRRGLYAMMLGLCGTDDDARLLEDTILEVEFDEKGDPAFRLGLDGLVGGYLLLSGERGLAVLDEKKLRDKQAPFSETYAAMQSLRFMWKYGDNRISPDRLRQSMRILLDRPELADLVIPELARMKDWSIQDRLIELYGAGSYDIPSVKRAIVRFTLSAAKDLGITNPASAPIAELIESPQKDLPVHVAVANKHLEDLERRDPKTFQDAKRFFAIK